MSVKPTLTQLLVSNISYYLFRDCSLITSWGEVGVIMDRANNFGTAS